MGRTSSCRQPPDSRPQDATGWGASCSAPCLLRTSASPRRRLLGERGKLAPPKHGNIKTPKQRQSYCQITASYRRLALYFSCTNRTKGKRVDYINCCSAQSIGLSTHAHGELCICIDLCLSLNRWEKWGLEANYPYSLSHYQVVRQRLRMNVAYIQLILLGSGRNFLSCKSCAHCS